MSSKTIKILLVVVFSLIAIGAVGMGVAYAQDETPENPFTPGGMMRGWRGQDDTDWMNTMHAWMNQTGGMHTLVWENLAEALGLTQDELSAELENGKTLESLAAEKGLDRNVLITVLENTHQDALAQGVADGALTQEQADSILSQMEGHYEWMIENMTSGDGYSMMSGYGSMMMGRFYNRQDSSSQFSSGGCHGYAAPSASQNRP